MPTQPDNRIGMLIENNYDAALKKIAAHKEMGHVRDVRDPKDADVRCVDGLSDYGQRIVAKDGSIRMAKSRWKHEMLIPFAGFAVGVNVVDYWISSVDIFYPRYPQGELICRLYAPNTLGL